MASQYTLADFISISNLKHNSFYTYPDSVYVNKRTKISILCPIHGTFDQEAGQHIKGAGCNLCAVRRVSKLKTVSVPKFIARSITKHGSRYDYSLVTAITHSERPVTIICPDHGPFEQTPRSHSSGRGCQHCRTSKGEDAISSWLYDNKIEFTRQQSFDGCIHKRKLKFDFYVPRLNMCIEFDGKQHFIRNEHFYRTIGDWDLAQNRDSIKTKYCIDNNIQLVRIRYDENIEAALESIF